MLQYVKPMAINTGALGAKYHDIKQVGLCHSVQNTSGELAYDLGIPVSDLRYRAAGINHMAFFLNLEARNSDGSFRDLYPDLHEGYRAGRIPKTPLERSHCLNKVRYETMLQFGHFVIESSGHFAE